jgi:hypothetical protein
MRRLILNGIVWTAKLEVPDEEVNSELPDLAKFQPESIEPAAPAPRTKGEPKKVPGHGLLLQPCCRFVEASPAGRRVDLDVVAPDLHGKRGPGLRGCVEHLSSWPGSRAAPH